MSKIAKKVAPIALPIAGSLIPGVGPVLGAAIGGGLGGAISGGGIGGIAKGAALGGAFGAAPALGAASGLGAVGTSALTRGIQGAALGGIGGGTKGALLGAGLGSLGGYLGAGGGIPGLGTVAGRLGPGGIGPPTPGTGVLGGLTRTLATGGQPVKLGSLLSAGANTLGYLQGESDLENIQEMLARQSQLAQGQLQPYSQAGTQALENLQGTPEDVLASDPGYQFRLQQGNQALERSLAARGLGQSGAALKAAQEYGQGLAGQTYDNFFNRNAQLANMGYGAASGLGNLYTNLGNVQAAAELERINQRNNLFSGLGGLFG